MSSSNISLSILPPCSSVSSAPFCVRWMISSSEYAADHLFAFVFEGSVGGERLLSVGIEVMFEPCGAAMGNVSVVMVLGGGGSFSRSRERSTIS